MGPTEHSQTKRMPIEHSHRPYYQGATLTRTEAAWCTRVHACVQQWQKELAKFAELSACSIVQKGQHSPAVSCRANFHDAAYNATDLCRIVVLTQHPYISGPWPWRAAGCDCIEPENLQGLAWRIF